MESQGRWGCHASFVPKNDGTVEWVEDKKTAHEPIMLGEEPHQEEWWRCPRRGVKDDPALYAELSHLWAIREKGFLPFPGSYFEQPNLYVQAMTVIDGAVAEVERMHDKKRQAMGNA